MIRVHTIDIEFSHYSNTLPSSRGELGICHPTPVMLMQCRQRWGGHTRPTRNLSNSSEQKRNQDERPLVNYVTLNSRANLIDFYTNGGRDQVLSAGDMPRDVIFPLVIPDDTAVQEPDLMNGIDTTESLTGLNYDNIRHYHHPTESMYVNIWHRRPAFRGVDTSEMNVGLEILLPLHYRLQQQPRQKHR